MAIPNETLENVNPVVVVINRLVTVSYTHLDVYKRQHKHTAGTEYYEYTRQDRPVSGELLRTSLPNG